MAGVEVWVGGWGVLGGWEGSWRDCVGCMGLDEVVDGNCAF